eukprot:486034-Hanusia_phi.AAC.1
MCKAFSASALTSRTIKIENVDFYLPGSRGASKQPASAPSPIQGSRGHDAETRSKASVLMS